MARWVLSLGVVGLLLGACAQRPVTPVDSPAGPRTMSTDEDDAATQVVVDAETNAYVFGTAGSSGFLNRYRADGTLLWHTDVVLPSCEGCRALELGLVGNTLYTLTDESDGFTSGAERVRLTAFSRSGEELLSRSARVTGTDIQEAVIGPNARSYVLSRTDEEAGSRWYIDAFDVEGKVRWSQSVHFPVATTTYTESGVSLALAPSGSVYLAGIGNLQKYSADGALEWARTFPFADETHLRAQLAAGEEAVYYVRDLTVGDVVPSNVEIKRFSATGEELWTRTLVDERALTTTRQVGATHLTIAPSGALFLLSEETYGSKEAPYVSFNALYKVRPDAQSSAGYTLEAAEFYDLAFAPSREAQPGYSGMDAEVSYLFMVGSALSAENRCYDPEDEEGPSAYCPDTDAFLTKRRLFSSDQDVSAAGELVWYRD
jgi:hypothetical protein